MSEQRPDTGDRSEPGGTPSTSQRSLTDRPATPAAGDGGPAAVPGAYEAEQERGKAVEPGN